MTKKTDQMADAISFIQSALGKCGQDFATSEVRGHLIAARNAAEHVLKKRGRRATQQTAMEEAAIKAHNLSKNWWETIQENVRKQAKADAEKPIESGDLDADL